MAWTALHHGHRRLSTREIAVCNSVIAQLPPSFLELHAQLPSRLTASFKAELLMVWADTKVTFV